VRYRSIERRREFARVRHIDARLSRSRARGVASADGVHEFPFAAVVVVAVAVARADQSAGIRPERIRAMKFNLEGLDVVRARARKMRRVASRRVVDRALRRDDGRRDSETDGDERRSTFRMRRFIPSSTRTRRT
jgi:hypothetical protein